MVHGSLCGSKVTRRAPRGRQWRWTAKAESKSSECKSLPHRSSRFSSQALRAVAWRVGGERRSISANTSRVVAPSWTSVAISASAEQKCSLCVVASTQLRNSIKELRTLGLMPALATDSIAQVAGSWSFRSNAPDWWWNRHGRTAQSYCCSSTC